MRRPGSDPGPFPFRMQEHFSDPFGVILLLPDAPLGIAAIVPQSLSFFITVVS
jgi:hypothetical protein